jgi:diguanylate cyclase (GGDEF)-like protein
MQVSSSKDDNSWEISFRNFHSLEGVINSRLELLGSQIVVSAILEKSPVGIVVLSTGEEILLINEAARKMFDYNKSVGDRVVWSEFKRQKILYNHDATLMDDESDPLLLALRKREKNTTNIMLKSQDPPGEEWMQVTSFPILRDNGVLISAVAMFMNISDIKGMEEVLYHQAIHDPLTGLSNRAFFSASLIKALARSRRSNTGIAMLMLDLDDFEKINNEHGQSVGDDLLKKVSARICSEVRETDVVARVGGDEFAILLTDIVEIGKMHVVGDVAERICRSIERPFNMSGQKVVITGSIGISIYPLDGSDYETLFSKAGSALVRVKQSDRGGWGYWQS